MTLRVSGKNLDIGEALRGQVETRVASTLSKYFDGHYSGHVTVEKEGTGFRTECVFHLASGVTLEVSGAAHDAYSSFDESAHRLETRLRRYKNRLKDRSEKKAGAGRAQMNGIHFGSDEGGKGISYSVLQTPQDDIEEMDNFHPVVIAETTKTLHVLSVSDAVLELDMTGSLVTVFRHASTGRVNVVYKRRDGTIGWVDPAPDMLS